jgi:hypothetical protein
VTSLPEPPPTLRGFPSSAPPAKLVRVCRRGRGTWWFSSDGSGRFDLHPPQGTCYLAVDPIGALREATRGGPVSTTWVADRVLRTVAPPDPTQCLAATTRQGAAGFGVTTELVTVVPYDLPRRWAAAFHHAGLAGIRHELRHDPRARPSGVSLFGPAGPGNHPDGDAEPVTPRALGRAGVEVIDVPPAAHLTIL